METINDVLKFLNQMEVFNILTGAQSSTFVIIRKILIQELENSDLDELIELLGILDNLYIEYLRKKLHFDKSLITSLREKIFDMYDEKMCRKK